MAITLDDVVLEQMETNQTLGMLHDQTILNFQMDNQFFGTLVNQFDEFMGLIREQMRLSDEQRRESRNQLIPPTPVPPTPREDSPSGGGVNIPIITGLAAIAATAIGTIQGFIDINAKIFSKTAERIKAVGTTIKGWFTAFGDRIKGFGKTIGGIFNIGDDVARAGQLVKDFFAPIRNFFSNLKNNPIVKFAGTVGRVIGRLLYPIMLAIDLFKGISGEFDQLAPDATLGDQVKAFAKGFIKGVQSFLFFPVELLKDVLSYLIGLIPGTEFITEFLDSFDIVDLAQGWTDYIFDNFENLLDAIKMPFEMIGDGIMFIANKAIEFGKGLTGLFDNIDFSGALKGMVKAILPPADFATFEIPSLETPIGTLGGGSINLNPVPSSLYEWAGQEAPPAPEPKTPPQAPTPELEEEIKSEIPERTTRRRRRREPEPEYDIKAEMREKRRQERKAMLQGVKDDAASMGLDPNNLKAEVVGGEVISINGQNVPAETLSGDTTKTVPADSISSATQNNFTSEINNRSVENVASSQVPPVVIQDNSVNSSNQNNVNNQTMKMPMSSPVNDNRTRASAYANG